MKDETEMVEGTVGATDAEPSDGGPRDLDRELIELLNELRVALPGVQVLFAFLLTVPFTQAFSDVTTFQRDVYFATLSCVAIATVLMIAPTPHHRILFRRSEKEYLLRLFNIQVLAGLAFLAVSIGGSMLLVADMLFERSSAMVVAGAVIGLLIANWYVLPIARRVQRGPRS